MKNRYRINLLKQHRQPDWDPSHGCHTVARLTKLFKVKHMAEVGVCYGHTAVEVLDKVKISQYFMIDIWRREEIYNKIVDNFSQDPAITIIRKNSMKATNDFHDESLDMVYLDTLHNYPQGIREIHAWIKKVRRGGVFVGDGYGLIVEGKNQMKRAVHEIFQPWQININLGKDHIFWVMRP